MEYTDLADFFGLDKYGRPNTPPFEKIWYEDGGYKGYIWKLINNRFYFNDIPVEATHWWGTMINFAFEDRRNK